MRKDYKRVKVLLKRKELVGTCLLPVGLCTGMLTASLWMKR
jgi:hypothetical protein